MQRRTPPRLPLRAASMAGAAAVERPCARCQVVAERLASIAPPGAEIFALAEIPEAPRSSR